MAAAVQRSMHGGRDGPAERSGSFSDDDEGGAGGRMSELLASYYGMQAAGGSTGGGGGGALREDLSGDIDSAAFDAEAFVRALLRGARQEALLSRDDAMLREVKKLDSDMQMLVYENYNKFIAATDTIRAMKQNVESMESEMAGLQGSMEKISAASGRISASLADKRGRVDTLVRVRRLLKRLEFLFELPEILRAAVERGAGAQAIKYYAMTRGILRRHAHVSSFGAILRESEDIMAALRARLQAKADSPGIAQAPFVETVSLLLRLGVARPALRDRFVAFHARLFTEWFDSSRRALVDDAGVPLEAAIAQLSQGFLPLLLRTAKGFLPLLLRTAKVYRRLFLPEGAPEEPDDLRPLQDSIAAAGVSLFFGSLHKKADAVAAAIEAASVAAAEAGGAGAHGGGGSSGGGDGHGDGDAAAEGAALVAALQQLHADADAFHARLPEARVRQKADAFARQACFRRVRCRFTAACAEGAAACAEFAATASDDVQMPRLEGVRSTYKRLTGYQVLMGDLVTTLSRAAEHAVEACAPLLRMAPGDEAAAAIEGALREHVHRCTWQFACWLRAAIEGLAAVTQRGREPAQILPNVDAERSGSGGGGYGGGAAAALIDSRHATGGAQAQLAMLQAQEAAGEVEAQQGLLSTLGELGLEAYPAARKARALASSTAEPSARVVLALASLCREMGASLVPRVAEMLARRVPQPALQEMDEAVRGHLNAGSDCLLDHYVEVAGCGLVAGLRNGYAAVDWAAVASPPADATPAALSVVAGAERAAAEVAAMLGEAGRPGPVSVARGDRDLRRGGARAGGRGGGGGAGGGSRKGVQLDIDRIFAGDVTVLGGGTRFTADSVLSGLLKVAFKAGVEIVRGLTLSCGGYQQVQADVELWRQALPYYVTDNAALADLDNLLDQMMVSAADRALDASAPLDSSALSGIVSRGLSKFK